MIDGDDYNDNGGAVRCASDALPTEVPDLWPGLEFTQPTLHGIGNVEGE